jgi:hypothetical protein
MAKLLCACLGSMLVAALVAGCGDDDGTDPADGAIADAAVVDAADDAATADAAVDAAIVGALPDVTGRFLFGLAPGFAPTGVVRFIADLELTPTLDGGGLLDISLQPISVDEGTPVGDPVLVEGVTVAADGTFEAPIGGEIDGFANPVTGTDLVFTAVLHGRLENLDLVCGTADGSVAEPAVSLDGSTFGAIRIEAGAIGNDDLPEPLVACPFDPGV